MIQRFRVVNLGAAGSGVQPPPTEVNPEFAAEPYSSTVDKLCMTLRKRSRQLLSPSSQGLMDEAMEILAGSGKYEDLVFDAMEKYCPDQVDTLIKMTTEIMRGRESGRFPRKGYNIPIPRPVPTPRSTTSPTPRTTSQAPMPARTSARQDTPTGRGQTSTVPTSTAIPVQNQTLQDDPGYTSIVPNVNPTPRKPDPARDPVPTGGYRSPLQQQIDSYETALREFQNRPLTPSAEATDYSRTYSPGEAEAEAQRRHQEWLRSQERQDVASVDPATGCPPGQFRATTGGPCRDSTGGYANFPGVPGGYGGTVTTAPLTAVSPGVTGMSGRQSYRVVNR